MVSATATVAALFTSFVLAVQPPTVSGGAVGLEDPLAPIIAPESYAIRTVTEEKQPEPVVIPLPPAIWTGLSTLTALALVGWSRRRKRQ